MVQCAPAALLLQPHHTHVGQLVGQLRGDPRCVVGTCVVRDGDSGRERNVLRQVAVKPMHRLREVGLLVVHRHHDVEDGNAARAGQCRGVGPGPKAVGRIEVEVGVQGGVGHALCWRPRLVHGGLKLCVSYDCKAGSRTVKTVSPGTLRTSMLP